MCVVNSRNLQRLSWKSLKALESTARSRGGRILRDQRGATSIEFALSAGVLLLLLLNGIDLGRYIYLRSQVETATQMGAHRIWESCDPMKLPIVTKCFSNQDAAKTAVVNVIATVVKSIATAQVALSQGYYCTNGTGTLYPVTLPAQCLSGATPGDYVQVQVTYSFAPLFANLTVASMFGKVISTTSYMRLQ
jgi:Flp pilus assembly protein TadG